MSVPGQLSRYRLQKFSRNAANVPFNTDAVETVARQLRDVTSGLQLIRKGNFFDFINFSNTINPGLVIVEGTQFPSGNERDRLEKLGKRKDLFVVYLAYK